MSAIAPSLPTFLVIGTQKAATTSLYEVLRRHPQVFMPATKELNFFFHEEEYRKGVAHYEASFAGATSHNVAAGEASPGYVCHPLAPERIAALLPGVKLILTVRDPITRAYSQYWHHRRTLSESRTWEQVIEIALDDTYEPGRLGYFSRGVYSKYIERYLSLFPRENLLVVVFEDLLIDPYTFFGKCFEFLGVDPVSDWVDVDQAHNPASIWNNPLFWFFFNHPRASRILPSHFRPLLRWGKRIPFRYPPMSTASRAELAAFYRPWNEKLFRFLGRSLAWYDG
ncbi:sulfotransferase domain-containing protein [Gemmatimonadota bacterium]